MFSYYFQIVFSSSNEISLPALNEQSDYIDVAIYCQGVFSMFLDIDVMKSPGPYNIPSKFLKQYGEKV